MTKSGFRIAALALFAVLFASNCYRAATQSIVHDEALTWQYYLAGPVSNIFQYYSPNHHFLATILVRISTTLFGDSELAMRLPTLLAGAWFFWTVFRLCAMVFGDGWLFLAACAVLALNPILLDFLVAARGYGLAVAGLFWALFQMLSWFDDRLRGVGQDQLRKRMWKAALGCAVAVAANLTLLFPAFVLALSFYILVVHTGGALTTKHAPASPPPTKTRTKQKKTKPDSPAPSRSRAPLIHFVVPVIVLGLVYVLAAPIDLAQSRDFYVGTPTALNSLRNLMNVSFAYANGAGMSYRIEQICSNIALVFLPAIAVAALIVIPTHRRNKQPSLIELATLLSSLAVVGSALLLAVAHALSGLPYPIDRTGIYFVPLACLAALGLARMLIERVGALRWAGYAVAAMLVAVAAEFAAQWNVNSFLVWRYDADTKRIFEALEAAPKPSGPIRLGVSWPLEPALNYYRETRKAAWLTPVERDGFDGPRQFYAAMPEDQSTAPWPTLKQIYKGPVSGTALAVPQSKQ